MVFFTSHKSWLVFFRFLEVLNLGIKSVKIFFNLKQVSNTGKLSLNLTETNFTIFYPRQKKINVTVPLVMEYYI